MRQAVDVRHDIVEGEPGGIPYHEWKFMMWIRERFSRHLKGSEPAAKPMDGDEPHGEGQEPGHQE